MKRKVNSLKIKLFQKNEILKFLNNKINDIKKRRHIKNKYILLSFPNASLQVVFLVFSKCVLKFFRFIKFNLKKKPIKITLINANKPINSKSWHPKLDKIINNSYKESYLN